MAVKQFLSLINVDENPKTGVYTLKVIGFEAKFVFELLSSFIEELDKHQIDYNKNKTSEARKFIEERIIDIEKELKHAEEVLKNFMDRNRRIENSPALQLEVQRLNREVSVLTGVFTTLKQQLETTKIQEVRESDYVVVIDAPELPIEKISPKRKSMLIISGFLGIAFGLFLVFMLELLKHDTTLDKKKLLEARRLLYGNISDLIKFKI